MSDKEMTMVERVARAIAMNPPIERYEERDGHVILVRDFEPSARAAIEEMRDPTRVMIDAPYDAGIDFGPGGTGDVDANPLNVWRAMIDAALNTKDHE